MEGDAPAGAAEHRHNRRSCVGIQVEMNKEFHFPGEVVVISILKSIWLVLLHMFQPRVTVQYPDEKPYLPPR